MRKLLLSLWIISLLVSISALEPPDTIYSVQIGAYETKEAAEARKLEFEEMGFTPVSIEYVSPWYKVRFGEFPFHMDAYLYRMDLRKGLCKGAFIVKKDNLAEKKECLKTEGPLRQIFDMKREGGGAKEGQDRIHASSGADIQIDKG